MNSANVIGPSARMRRRMRSATARLIGKQRTGVGQRAEASVVPARGEGVARTSACKDSPVEPLRKAASAIVGRDGEDGLEVLVLERGSSSRFLAGYVAF